MSGRKNKHKKVIQVGPMAMTRSRTFPGTRIPLPPRYIANIKFTHRYRYYNSIRVNAGALVTNINAPKLGGLVSFSNVANTNVQQLFEQVQIRSIQLWGTPPVDGSTSFASIIANNGAGTSIQTGDDKAVSDTSMGTMIPCYCYKHFSNRRGRFNFFAGGPQATSTANNGVLFTLTISGTNADAANTSHCNFICDIVMEGILSNDARNTNNLINAGVVALPNLYYLALDNQGGGNLSSTSLWVPDPSLVTTS